MAAEPCFVCDPSLLPPGTRCATGYPICAAHLAEILGDTKPKPPTTATT